MPCMPLCERASSHTRSERTTRKHSSLHNKRIYKNKIEILWLQDFCAIPLLKLWQCITLVCCKLEKNGQLLCPICWHSHLKARRGKVPCGLAASLNAPEKKCCGLKSPGTSVILRQCSTILIKFFAPLTCMWNKKSFFVHLHVIFYVS